MFTASWFGCAGTFQFAEDEDGARYRHRELGYEIDYPSVLTRPGWQIEPLDDSDLHVRHPDGSAWAIASNCRATVARVETLAAELARATGGRALEPGRPIVHAGLEGWSQRLEGRDNGHPVDIKTVTVRGPRCTYDWILLAPDLERLDALAPDFDAWWQSFEPGPGDLVPETGE